MTLPTNRRGFLKTTAAAGFGFWLGGSTVQTGRSGPNERINIAIIGAGGRGAANLSAVRNENIVALCDPDENQARDAFNRYPNAQRFADYRQMLERLRNQIDAVVVSTPDHNHAPASIMAMRMGKHVYCEKPLTHSVYEARQMKLVAREKRVVTQMGNQGTASDGLREGVEVIQAGAIGPVREVHVWTNRPIWPQSNIWQQLNREPGPLPQENVPQTLSWDVWLGPAPSRPYNHHYLPFNWRGWWDYGTGAIGDMACHTMNLPFMALRLEAPTAVSARIDDRPNNRNNQTPPVGCVVTYEFPARGDMPALTMKWYERNLPPRELFHGRQPSGSGCLIVGERGTLYSSSDYGGSYQLLPEDRFRDFQRPERRLPRVGGNHHGEWLNAIRGTGTPMSNFPDYASKLTETALLGNIAIRIGGARFEWNAEELRASTDEANRFVRREYREGWRL